MGASTSCTSHKGRGTLKRKHRLSATVEDVKDVIKGRWVGRERNKINTENKPKTDRVTRERMEDHNKNEKLQCLVH